MKSGSGNCFGLVFADLNLGSSHNRKYFKFVCILFDSHLE